MNAITPFSFDSQQVRVHQRDGEPWFVLADICRILELNNPTKAAAGLEDDEKHTLPNTEGHTGHRGGAQFHVIVSESGMWQLVMRSRKPQAKAFRRFITGEVIPSIRRTGTYGAPASALNLSDPAILQRLLIEHTGRSLASDARVAELEPKAEAFDRLASAEGSLCITDAAKAMGVSPKKLFAWMEAHDWIYRRSEGGHWVACQRRLDSSTLEHEGRRVKRRGLPDKLVEQVMVTSKGLTRLATLKAGA